MPKICLFDASGYLFRAYHALPPLSNSKGEPLNAVYGFSRMISKALQKEKPDYVAVCFDTPEPTFRHEAYEEYKANRDEPDEDIIVQIPIAEELVEKWGLPAVKKPGFEADDVIATLAIQAEKKGWDVLVLSGDKDILQLVSKKITVRDDMRKTDYNEAKVEERYGIKPNQLVDLLSLVGDKVDNVIGVPGVGEKTASKLLVENGNLENLFKDLKGAKPAVKEKLGQFKDKVFKNRTLIELKKDVSLGRGIESFKVKPPDPKLFPEMIQRLEFRGELYGLNGVAEETGLSANKKRKVTTVLTQDQLSLLQDAASKASRISYDLETDGTNPHQCQIVGVALSIKKDEAWYIPVGHQNIEDSRQIPWSDVRDVLKPLLENQKTLKLGQNLKFDNTILARFGIDVKGPGFDTMIAAYCLEPEKSSFGLKDLAAELLGEKMIRFEELVGKGKDKTIADVPSKEVAIYAGADAEVVVRLADLFEPKLTKNQVADLFEKLEMPLVHVLQEMETNGIRIDVPYLKSIGSKFAKEMKSYEDEIFKLAGEKFTLNSPKQLSRILFEKLKLPPVKKTKTGYSTNEAVLTRLAEKNPICQKILAYRELSKLTSTYVDSLIDLANPKTNRVHTSFHQTGTSTGRLSSTKPNLQNIPIRTSHGREIRKAFIASDKHVLLSADYSQIDLRSLAHMSEDAALVKAFQAGGDIHATTAAEVFHVKPNEVTTDMRRKAKAINFGIVYGQQAWGLSQGLGIDVTEAQEFIQRYFDRYSGVKEWIDKTMDQARKKGFVTTLAGRRRGVPDINSTNNNVRGFAERIAMNTPIQGSSADIIKAAMIQISAELKEKKLKSKMMVQVHDELLFDVPEAEVDQMKTLVAANMEQAYKLKVPLLVDMKMGVNWNEMELVER